MRLDNKKYEEIKQAVIDTFLEYDVRCIPISAFELAVKMGLRVVPYSSLSRKKRCVAVKISLDGFLVEKNDGIWLIYYNDECKTYGRINQTIMHEIGHYILGHIHEGEAEEAEANFFAKYALAPPPLIHNMVKPVKTETIMDKFDISHQAAEIAYKYYQSWLRYGGKYYTEYEKKMLELFEVA